MGKDRVGVASLPEISRPKTIRSVVAFFVPENTQPRRTKEQVDREAAPALVKDETNKQNGVTEYKYPVV